MFRMDRIKDIISDIKRELMCPKVGLSDFGPANGLVPRTSKWLTEARGKGWVHWWMLPSNQVVKVPEGTHFHYVAMLTPQKAQEQFGLSGQDWKLMHDADVENKSAPTDVIRKILNAGAIRLSLYGNDLGIETASLDDSTLWRIQKWMPSDAKPKTVTWDSPFSSDPPISTLFAELMSASSIEDLKPKPRSSLAMFREADNSTSSIDYSNAEAFRGCTLKEAKDCVEAESQPTAVIDSFMFKDDTRSAPRMSRSFKSRMRI